ncbi:MAG: hypothetical protein O2856_07180 [Planctomycetota bacterium]|nr:hypothetical protein [Planctomycetota bacterium]
MSSFALRKQRNFRRAKGDTGSNGALAVTAANAVIQVAPSIVKTVDTTGRVPRVVA